MDDVMLSYHGSNGQKSGTLVWMKDVPVIGLY